MPGQPYGGLVISAGSTLQALTTAPGKVVTWTAKGQSDSYSADGDPAVFPDLANNRIKINTPGVYMVTAQLSGFSSGAADILMQVRKNGSVIQADLSAEVNAIQAVFEVAAAPTGIPAGNIAANETVNTALTAITGLLATDTIIAIEKPTTQPGLQILPADLAQGGVTGAGTATVAYVNDTVAGITPTPGETYTFVVVRAGRASFNFTGILNITSLDNPKTLGTFADPVNPPSLFSGAGGAPLTETVLDLVLSTLSGSVNFTPEYAQLTVLRLR